MTDSDGFLICNGCQLQIDIDTDDYHTPHEYDCPNFYSVPIAECDCDLHFHERCCPECNCEGDHDKHYGELWTCEGCGKRFCWAEGSDDMIELCNKCWLVATLNNNNNSQL